MNDDRRDAFASMMLAYDRLPRALREEIANASDPIPPDLVATIYKGASIHQVIEAFEWGPPPLVARRVRRRRDLLADIPVVSP